jgi:MFS family permease
MELRAETEDRKEPGIKNVVNLGVVSFFTDISSEMILGILPLFVTIDLGATKALLGLMEGAAESLNYLFRTFAGVVSDRIASRKPLVVLGYALSTVAKPFFSLTSNFAQAVIVRLTDRAGKGIRTSPRDALISDSVKESVSGRAFGIHRSLDQLGAVAGPLLAFFLIPLIGVRNLFLTSLIPGGIAVLFLILFVVDKKGQKRTKSIFANAGEVLSNRRFKNFLFIIGVFGLGAYNFSFVLVEANRLGVDQNTVPLVYLVLNMGTVVAGLPAGLLADRIGKDKVVLGAFVLFAVATLAGLISPNGVWFGFAIGFLYGLYLGTSDTVQRAVIPSLTGGELKGTAYAIYYLLLGACSLVANLVFGTLWDMNPNAAYSYSLVTSLLAIAGFAMLTVRWSKTPSSERIPHSAVVG